MTCPDILRTAILAVGMTAPGIAAVSELPPASIPAISPSHSMAMGDMWMLQTRLTPGSLSAALPEPGTWRWWPAAADRKAWQAVLTPVRQAWLLARAEEAVAKGWPALPASLFLDCARTGNRARGEEAYFARRQYLGYVTLAYVATREPRWLDLAMDALWAVAEESTWCLPAHISGRNSQSLGLPRHDVPVVDLFAAETAAVVSDALDLLRDDLDLVDPRIVPRLVHELRVRVVDPVTKFREWTWLSGRNNWTPWIMANAGRTVLAHARDRAGMADVVTRFLGAGDRFLANYGADGGCDEGIRYWGMAFGSLFLYLEALHEASAGGIDLLSHPQFKALGTFPVNAYLGGRWFLPFADNRGTGGVRRALGWHIGERLQLPALQYMAWLENRKWDAKNPASPMTPGSNGSALQELLWQLFWMPAEATVAAPPAEPRTWLPSLQVLVVRTPGLVLAVKGGHNEENHNHNDVGCVHVLKGGVPVVIDPGVEAYSMKTFSAERYQIWCIRGAGHNAPVINGHEQQFGRAHAGRAVRAWTEGEVECFTVDLAACYAAEADVRSAVRTLRFDTVTQHIDIEDVVDAGSGTTQVVTNWFTVVDPRRAHFTLDFAASKVEVSDFPLEDAGLQASWQTKQLWRVTATVQGSGPVTAHCRIR